ncbi:MAG: hypothetical protein PHP00_01000 [Thiotrichaceae bacterium]|nr:hypothetical protein [Thiotrichaceae bacterium]
MEMFKIEHFKTAYPNIEFPEFYNVDNADLLRLQNRLFDKLNVKDRDLLKLTKTLNSRTSVISGVNAEHEDFCLSSVLFHENIKPNEWVYLNWYRYDQVDKMIFSELEKYFDDIWYPSSDDLDIFDDSYAWILSIRHYGVLSLLRFT